MESIFWSLKQIAGVFVALALLTLPTVAVAASLSLGGLEVTVGMKRQTLLAQMSGYEAVCVLRPGEPAEPINCDFFMVRSKSPPNAWLGSVEFAGDTVARVTKGWSDAYEGTNPSRFAVTLYDVLRGINGGDGTLPATITIQENRDVTTSFRRIDIRTKDRTVSILGKRPVSAPSFGG